MSDDELEQAAEWIEDADRWTSARRAAFLVWLAERPTHLEAAQRIWAVLEDSTLEKALAAWAAPRPAATMALVVDAPRRWHRFAFGGVAVAASLATAFVLLKPAPATMAPVLIATAHAAMRTARLADGSIVHLDPDSALAVTFAADARRLRLRRGRALFEVAHDAARPFTVDAGAIAAVAVGTVFSVDRIGAAVEIRVEQGMVRASNAAGATVLPTGTGARFAGNGPPVRLRLSPDPQSEASGAWLRADRDRLDSIIARLQRRASVTLDIDPAVAALPITGRFRFSDPEGSLRLIATTNNLRLERAPGRLRVER